PTILFPNPEIGFGKPRHRIEQSISCRCRNPDRCGRSECLTQRGIVEVSKVKPFVRDDRSANAGAEPVLVKSRLRDSLPLELLTGGIQVSVLEIFVHHPGNFVRSTV